MKNQFLILRNFFNYCFDNPEKVNPNHIALFSYILDLNNRIGGKDKFGLPTTVAMECIGIKSYKTYIKTLLELLEFGFINMIQKSTNQYTANIIEVVNFTEANTKALDKANTNASPKQVLKQVQSNDSIDNSNNSNNKDNSNNITYKEIFDLYFSFIDEIKKTISWEATQMILKINTKDFDVDRMFTDLINLKLSDQKSQKSTPYKKASDLAFHFTNYYKTRNLDNYRLIENKDVHGYIFNNTLEEINLPAFLLFWNKTLKKDKQSWTTTEIALLLETHKKIGKVKYGEMVNKISQSELNIKNNFEHVTVEYLSKENVIQKYLEFKPTANKSIFN